jgi:hypothetical protein
MRAGTQVLVNRENQNPAWMDNGRWAGNFRACSQVK